MKHLILFLVFTLIIIAGCKKENLPYTFTGKVTDINGNGVSGATVVLDANYKGNTFSPGYAKEIAKAKTDNAGNYNIAFNYDSDINGLDIVATANNYFTYYTYNVFTSNIRNNVLIQNITIYKLATIKINFKNLNPVSNTDAFSVFQSNELPGPPFNTFIERNFSGGTYD